jgi:EpsD family peptidyl-prolyl cis-trans isomerase
VAAEVDGDPVTVAQLDAELRAAAVPNSGDPAVRRAALQRIVARKLMAKAAQHDGLDRRADAAWLKAAALETWEASLAQSAVIAAAGTPSAAEARAFVAAHPEMFASRTTYLVEQLVLAQQPSPDVARALEPANTMEVVEDVLRARGVAYRHGAVQLDTLRLDPALTRQVRGLDRGELFVLPDRPGLSINRVQASRTEPITGSRAEAIATQILREQRRAQAVRDRVEALRGAAKITYGTGFAPAG